MLVLWNKCQYLVFCLAKCKPTDNLYVCIKTVTSCKERIGWIGHTTLIDFCDPFVGYCFTADK